MDLMKRCHIPEVEPSARGKVRDLYALGDQMLIVVTDRVSAFDVVFDACIPDKGGVLNSLSAFWFDRLQTEVPHHMITTDPSAYPEPFCHYASRLARRSMLVKTLTMVPAECIVRAYLEGSALASYRKDRTIGGITIPPGLRQGDRLPEPLFTPSTKADTGHDITISFAELKNLVGVRTAHDLRDTSLALFAAASRHAETKGLILADTKLEFGYDGARLTLGDEAFTPDSSRFWDQASWQPGHEQKSFDKQFLREWLDTLDWDKTPPAPPLPNDIIEKTAARYRDAWARLTGTPWART